MRFFKHKKHHWFVSYSYQRTQDKINSSGWGFTSFTTDHKYLLVMDAKENLEDHLHKKDGAKYSVVITNYFLTNKKSWPEAKYKGVKDED